MKLFNLYFQERNLTPNEHGIYEGGGVTGHVYCREETLEKAITKAGRALNDGKIELIRASIGPKWIPAATRYTPCYYGGAQEAYLD